MLRHAWLQKLRCVNFCNSGLEEQNMGDTQISFEVNLDSAEEIDVPLTFFRLLIFIVGILGNLLVIFVILILAEYKKAVTHW